MDLEDIRHEFLSILKPEVQIFLEDGHQVDLVLQELEEALILLKEEHDC